MLRGIFMPAGVKPEQVQYYVDLFKSLRETPEWKKFMEDGAFNQTFMAGKEYAAWVAKAETLHRDLMKEAGFLAAGEEIAERTGGGRDPRPISHRRGSGESARAFTGGSPQQMAHESQAARAGGPHGRRRPRRRSHHLRAGRARRRGTATVSARAGARRVRRRATFRSTSGS